MILWVELAILFSPELTHMATRGHRPCWVGLSFHYPYSYSSVLVPVTLPPLAPSELGAMTSSGFPLMPDSECFTILADIPAPWPHLYERAFRYILLNSPFGCANCFLQGL